MAVESTAVPVSGGKPVKKLVERSQRSWLQRNLHLLLIAPAFLVPTALTGAAILSHYYALTDFDIRYGISSYVGLENYIYILTKDPNFRKSILVTFKLASLALLIELPLGFFLAFWLDKLTGTMVKIARALLVIPMCIAPVVATLMMKVMLGPTGGVYNYFLRLAGMPALDFFGDKNVVLFTLVFIDLWVATPFVILVFWGGFQTLPKAPYEAAELDGASPWFIFRKLTVPLLKPFLWIVLLFRVADTLNMMDPIYVSTKGGPGNASRSLTILIFDNGFRYSLIGYSVAMVFFMWVIVMVIEKRLVARFPR